MGRKKLIPRMKCPKCHSDDLDVRELQRDDRCMIEGVRCGHCGKSWTEHYKLVLEAIEDDEDE